MIRYQKFIKVNQLVDIEVEDEETVNLYRSRIEEVADDHLWLAMPSYRGLPIILLPGMEILVRFVRGGAVYQFKTTYQNKLLQQIPVWVVSLPYDFAKIQRRSFFRLEVYIPVVLEVEPGDEPESQEIPPMNLHAKDISAGGIRLTSKTPLDPETKVRLEISLTRQITVKTRGRVIRSEVSPLNSTIHWISIEFVDLDERDRKKLVTFVFNKQLEQR